MDSENLIPVCPQGCNADRACCQCCIYVPNLNEMELRTMIVTQEQMRVETDPTYAERKRQEYDARYNTTSEPSKDNQPEQQT